MQYRWIRSDITVAKVEKLYWDEKLSLTQIAPKLGCSVHTVWRRLKMGRGLRTISEAILVALEDRDPLRTRGRLTDGQGYVWIRRSDHPRANENGYVSEHILVWEQAHGRSVPKGYIIHHLNGIRDDNRPENLVALPRKAHGKQGNTYIRSLQQRIRELEEKTVCLTPPIT